MRIKVNSYSRKGRIVKQHSRNAIISTKKRKVLDKLALEPYEVGGYMDFEKSKGLENMKVHLGDRYQVEFDDDPDFEVQFHSHPEHSVMPSYQDIVSMKDSSQKEQLIFNKKVALSIYENNKFRKVPDYMVKRVTDSMEKDYNKGMKDKALYDKYKPVFKDRLGLDMQLHAANKPIKLKTKVI